MNRNGTILLVEDSFGSLRLLTEVLSAEGHTVMPADSAEGALASASATRPELILLDLRVRGMDGFELLGRLKESEATRDIPVILLAETHAAADCVRGLELGAVDFVAKPFEKEELRSRIALHLELSRSRQRLRESEERLLEAQEVACLGYYSLDVASGDWTSSKIHHTLSHFHYFDRGP